MVRSPRAVTSVYSLPLGSRFTVDDRPAQNDLPASVPTGRNSSTVNANSARAHMAEMAHDLAQKTKLVESLTAELERAAEEIDRLHRMGGDHRHGPVHTVDIHALRETLAECQEELSATNAQVEALRKSLGECEAELEARNKLIEPLQAALAESEADLEATNAQIEPLRKMLAECEAELAGKDTQFEPLRKALAACEEELASRNALVENLTEQLERAAAEIDRMQRSGADRRRGGGGGGVGFPADLIDDQRQLAADMQRIVQQWEDLQAGFALGRIEIQLTELREFVGERLDHPRMMPAIVESSEPAPVVTEHAPLATSRLFRTETKEPPAPAATSGLSAWEQLKSQMLDLPPETAAKSNEPEFAANAEPLPDAPGPIDEATDDFDVWRAAVYERDAYIAALLRRLRAAEEVTIPQDWSQLDAASPDFAEAMRHMAGRLEETLRMAEVELSIERAQVARTQMQVAAQQEAISKQLKRLGITSVDELGGMAASAAGAPDRRWTRFLGTKK